MLNQGTPFRPLSPGLSSWILENWPLTRLEAKNSLSIVFPQGIVNVAAKDKFIIYGLMSPINLL